MDMGEAKTTASSDILKDKPPSSPPGPVIKPFSPPLYAILSVV